MAIALVKKSPVCFNADINIKMGRSHSLRNRTVCEQLVIFYTALTYRFYPLIVVAFSPFF